jgi:DNA adenine methylase
MIDELAAPTTIGKVAQPFRYPGGKFYALGILEPFWANVHHSEYREPFVGGGSVFFHKPKVSTNWLNDLDTELITGYEVMSDPFMRQQLVDRLSIEVASKERWREMFEFQPKNKLDIAYKYYYLNRTSFSGKMISPGWGYRPKRSLPPERWSERIIPCGRKLEGVKLTAVDFEEVILSGGSEQVLMFVDPPYFNPPKKKHYRNGFDLQDHLRLAKTLKETSHKFFLTYDNVPQIKELYSWANVHEVNFFYRVENSAIQNGLRRVGFELVITNYDTPMQLSVFN